MKSILYWLAIIATGLMAGCANQKVKSSKQCYKGRLEVKGMCSNYTIALLEGAITDSVQPAWTDETTGKRYNNVFKLANPCAFPQTINAGDEFYFTIDTSKQERCAVCMAYYPTPQKALNIKVLPNRCN